MYQWLKLSITETGHKYNLFQFNFESRQLGKPLEIKGPSIAYLYNSKWNLITPQNMCTGPYMWAGEVVLLSYVFMYVTNVGT